MSLGGQLAGVVTMPRLLWIGADVDVVIGKETGTGLRTAFAGTFIDDAVIALELRNDTGNQLGTTVLMDHVTGSSGKYIGVLPSETTALCEEHEIYHVDITITSGAMDDQRRLSKVAGYHAETP